MAERSPRRRRGSPTISDVAARAGVSPMTVSRVINGEARVRAATREAVEAAVAALGYQPDPAARSLAGAGRLRIGLFYVNPSAGYLSELLVGSLDETGRRDIQLVVEACAPGWEAAAVRHLIDGGLDGVILPPPLCDSPDISAMLVEAGVPVVMVASGRPTEASAAVAIDDHAAAEAMTRHLLSLGHRRIGFVTGDANQTASTLRLEGYHAALSAAGVAPDAALVATGDYGYRSGLDAAEALLTLSEPPTAIFASNDDMAAAAVATAHRRGLDVPGDLSVCGFDDTALATAIWPSLTTIRQPIAAMARVAVELLVAAIRRPAEPRAHRLLDFTLMRRQSDAAPR